MDINNSSKRDWNPSREGGPAANRILLEKKKEQPGFRFEVFN